MDVLLLRMTPSIYDSLLIHWRPGFALFGTNTHILYKEWLEDSLGLHILGRGRNRVLLQGLKARPPISTRTYTKRQLWGPSICLGRLSGV